MKNPKVGELVCGKKKADNEYYVTTSQMTRAEIVEVYSPEYIRIKAIHHRSLPVSGEKYEVNPKFFKRIVPKI